MHTRVLNGSPLVTTVRASIVALTLLLAACGGSPASPAPSAATGTASPAASVAGPTDFAAWTERQGFGGSSGLNNVAKLVTRGDDLQHG